MENKTMVAIGHNENAYVFNAIGIEGVIASEKSFKTILLDYIKKDVKIIIVSQHFDNQLDEIKKEYQEVYPIFITLSMEHDEDSKGIEKLRKNVEKATGITIF